MSDLNRINERPSKKEQLIILIAVLMAIAGAFFYLSGKARYDRSYPFLRTDSRANWILQRFRPSLKGKGGEFLCLSAEYTKDFRLSSVSEGSYLYIKAFKKYRLWLNGKEVLAEGKAEKNWKKTSVIEISRFLKKGLNRIKVEVTSDYGPTAVWLYSEGLPEELKTDRTWMVSTLGRGYVRADLANDSVVHQMSFEGIRPYDALTNKRSVLIVFFGFSFGLFWLHRYIQRSARFNKQPLLRFLTFTPKSVLIISLFFWTILFISNLSKVPIKLGFDHSGHLNYFKYILDNHSLPLASQGWQTYNPPLFYFFSAIIFSFGRWFLSEGRAEYLLKLIPFFSGLGQIYIAYVASGLCFPKSKTKQAISTAIASMIPMSIYMSHYISNEAFFGFMMSLSLLLTIRILRKARSSLGLFCVLGLVTGLAILTKVTALVMLPIIFLVLLYKLFTEERCRLAELVQKLGLVFLLIIVVAGWFFLRNQMNFGSFMVFGWEGAAGFNWWQEPGYHTYKYFCQFGQVFSLPYFAGFYSFFDSLYSTFWGDSFLGGRASFVGNPPWDYEYMSAVYLLSVPAAVLIVIGLILAVGRAVRRADKVWLLMSGAFFALACALVSLNLRVPYYCHAKAFYGLCVMLPICLFFAAGFALVDNWLKTQKLSIFRAVLYGWFGMLALSIFMTFLIR